MFFIMSGAKLEKNSNFAELGTHFNLTIKLYGKTDY